MLSRIRRHVYREPLNSGLNHPKTIYIPLGHGEEIVGERHVVPKGCILVVKSHSGDTRMFGDIIQNVNTMLTIENKEIVFDPVAHKKELFTIFNSDFQSRLNNITASHSTAIYREGDTYNNFVYQMLNISSKFGSIRSSGLFKLDYDTPSAQSDFKEVRLINVIDTMPAFMYDSKTRQYIYNTELPDISTLFVYSNSYPYYYTRVHVKEILIVLLLYVNLFGSGYMDKSYGEEKLYEGLKDRYEKLKKGYVYNPNNKDDSNSPVNIFATIGGDLAYYIEVRHVCSIIIAMTTTTQAELFDDVQKGILKPGIFYNLICRTTDKTTDGTLNTTGFLNIKAITNNKHRIQINKIGEVTNRISESILQRKNQAKKVFTINPNGNTPTKKYKRGNNGKWVENTSGNKLVGQGGKRTRRQRR